MKRITLALVLSLMLLILSVIMMGTKADIVTTNGLHLSYAPYIVFPYSETYRSVSTLNVSFHAAVFGNTNFSMT
jgi:hypothetical protein